MLYVKNSLQIITIKRKISYNIKTFKVRLKYLFKRLKYYQRFMEKTRDRKEKEMIFFINLYMLISYES